VTHKGKASREMDEDLTGKQKNFRWLCIFILLTINRIEWFAKKNWNKSYDQNAIKNDQTRFMP
jgi:hypothetical protein